MRWVVTFITFVTLAVSSPAEAQNETSFGLKAGLSAASVFANVEDASFRLRPGLTATVFAELPLTPALSIQPEAGYVQRGFGERFDEAVEPVGNATTIDPDPIQMRYRFDYVTLPLFVKARLADDGLVPYVIAGPRLDLLIRGSRTLVAPTPPPPQVPPNHEERYRSTSLGATLGAGIYPGLIEAFPLFGEFRVHLDATDSYDANTTRMHNWGFDVLLGLQF